MPSRKCVSVVDILLSIQVNRCASFPRGLFEQLLNVGFTCKKDMLLYIANELLCLAVYQRNRVNKVNWQRADRRLALRGVP